MPYRYPFSFRFGLRSTIVIENHLSSFTEQNNMHEGLWECERLSERVFFDAELSRPIKN